MFSRILNHTLIIAVGLLLTAGPAMAVDNPTLIQAITDYNGRKYKDALTKLEALTRVGQANDKAHYYMALCYQGVNQMSTAKSEYTWVYSNSRDATLRYNAWKALQAMDRWSQHRAYEGQGNDFSRLSPTNSAGEQFRQNKAITAARQDAEDAAAAARPAGGGGG